MRRCDSGMRSRRRSALGVLAVWIVGASFADDLFLFCNQASTKVYYRTDFAVIRMFGPCYFLSCNDFSGIFLYGYDQYLGFILSWAWVVFWAF